MGVSGGSVGPLEELASIYEGGDNFLARMKAFSDQKSAIQQMLAELNFGRPAKAAYDDALAKQDQASKVLDDAKAAAAKLVSDAQDKASALVNDATLRAADLDKKSSDAYATADLAKTQALTLKNSAAELAANLDGQKSAALEAKTAADQARSEYEKKLAAIKALAG